MRYILVGGNPFTPARGGTTFTALHVVGSHNDLTYMRDIIWNQNYDKCGGLMVIIDCQTGKEAKWP